MEMAPAVDGDLLRDSVVVEITILMGGSNTTRGSDAYRQTAEYYDQSNRRSYIAAYLRARLEQMNIPLKVNVSAG